MGGNSNTGHIQCGKCSAQNEANRNKCRSCGGHLYLICRKCRQKFARFLDLCPTCGENNHHHRDVSKFVTTAQTDEEALALLKALGMPFVRRDAA